MKHIETKEYIDLLFDQEDTICLCNQVESFGTFLKPADAISQNHEFIVINPVDGGRKDENVTKYRNFLIEIDDLDLRDQYRHMRDIALPFSAITYSGGKSFHYIISLETPVSSEALYLKLGAWIQNIVQYADKSTKNPAQLSRFPNVKRESTGKIQKFVKINSRVKNDDLLQWLKTNKEFIPKSTTKKGTNSHSQNGGRDNITRLLNWYIETYLEMAPHDGGRIFVQCPICAENGRDTSRDNMCISGDEMLFTCFANQEEHSPNLLAKLYDLRRQYNHEIIKKIEDRRKRSQKNE